MMHKGEVATLICGPQYAFGAAGAPPKIPANATVETRLELVDWLDLAVTYNAVPGKVETDDELRARWKEELADGTSPMRTEAGAWGVGGGRGGVAVVPLLDKERQRQLQLQQEGGEGEEEKQELQQQQHQQQQKQQQKRQRQQQEEEEQQQQQQQQQKQQKQEEQQQELHQQPQHQQPRPRRRRHRVSVVLEQYSVPLVQYGLTTNFHLSAGSQHNQKAAEGESHGGD